MTVLQCLRIFGPVPISEISRRCNVNERVADIACKTLEKNGDAVQVSDGTWDASTRAWRPMDDCGEGERHEC